MIAVTVVVTADVNCGFADQVPLNSQTKRFPIPMAFPVKPSSVTSIHDCPPETATVMSSQLSANEFRTHTVTDTHIPDVMDAGGTIVTVGPAADVLSVSEAADPKREIVAIRA
jgi:hypothetical protein